MKISVFAYSRKGCDTALNIIEAFNGEEITAFCPARIHDDEPEIFSEIPKDFRKMYGEQFGISDAMVFVGACGIAVREIAPFVKSKKTDPAVLVVDDKGRYVIPLLSGHIGGANQLAARLASRIDSTPVITTATDINGRFSVDSWAAVNGFHISSMKAAKEVSAVILEQDIPILSDYPVTGEYPPGTYKFESVCAEEIVPTEAETVFGSAIYEPDPSFRTATNASEHPQTPLSEDVPGIYIGWKTESPFKTTLRLIPKTVHLGIGCRRGTPAVDIGKAVRTFLADNHIDIHAVKSAASIDLKKDEEGLLRWCEEQKIPICFYTAGELNEVEGDFPSSDFVKSVTGTDNVCERAALKSAARIIVHKTAYSNVTVAAAIENMEVKFN